MTFINLPVLQGPASVQAAAWAGTRSHGNKSFFIRTLFFHPSLPGPALVQAARRGKAYSPAKLFAKSCMPDLWAMAEYWLDNIQKCGNNLNWF